jgi:hypothetical protein
MKVLQATELQEKTGLHTSPYRTQRIRRRFASGDAIPAGTTCHLVRTLLASKDALLFHCYPSRHHAPILDFSASDLQARLTRLLSLCCVALTVRPIFYNPQASPNQPGAAVEIEMMRAPEGMTAFKLSSPSGMCAASSWMNSDG